MLQHRSIKASGTQKQSLQSIIDRNNALGKNHPPPQTGSAVNRAEIGPGRERAACLPSAVTSRRREIPACRAGDIVPASGRSGRHGSPDRRRGTHRHAKQLPAGRGRGRGRRPSPAGGSLKGSLFETIPRPDHITRGTTPRLKPGPTCRY